MVASSCGSQLPAFKPILLDPEGQAEPLQKPKCTHQISSSSRTKVTVGRKLGQQPAWAQEPQGLQSGVLHENPLLGQGVDRDHSPSQDGPSRGPHPVVLNLWLAGRAAAC